MSSDFGRVDGDDYWVGILGATIVNVRDEMKWDRHVITFYLKDGRRFRLIAEGDDMAHMELEVGGR